MRIVGVSISILIFFVFVANCHVRADDTLVLALSFDEGQGDVAGDSSQYGFDGTIMGPQWVNGKFGSGMGFDGVDDSIEIADAPELRLLDGGTVMAWANILGGGHASWPRLIHKSNTTGGTGPGYEILFDRANGDAVRVCLGGECQSYVPLDRGTWYHVAMTFDGAMIRVYVDGEPAGENPQLGPTIDSPDLSVIVGNSFNGERQFEGTIDEVRIWSRILGVDEIRLQMGMATNDVVSSVAPHSKLVATWAEIKNQ
jgi:hypothetical protein